MMNNKKHEVNKDARQLSSVLAVFLFLGGLLLGSVAGAMLLMAPQSGKKNPETTPAERPENVQAHGQNGRPKNSAGS